MEEARSAGCWGEPRGVGPRVDWHLEPALELRPKLQRAVSSPPKSSPDALLSPGHDRGGLGTRAPELRSSEYAELPQALESARRAAGGGKRGMEKPRKP